MPGVELHPDLRSLTQWRARKRLLEIFSKCFNVEPMLQFILKQNEHKQNCVRYRVFVVPLPAHPGQEPGLYDISGLLNQLHGMRNVGEFPSVRIANVNSSISEGRWAFMTRTSRLLYNSSSSLRATTHGI
jgi:hypothetical protein